MVLIGDRQEARDGQPEDLREWCGEMWDSSYLPKIRNIIYVTLASVASVAVVVMIFIANYKVKAADHASKAEVKEVETELKYELQGVKEELQSDIDDLTELHQKGFIRLEDKMDSQFREMMKSLNLHREASGK